MPLFLQRTEREIKRLHEDIDRENQAHAQLSAWEASQAAQQQQANKVLLDMRHENFDLEFYHFIAGTIQLLLLILPKSHWDWPHWR